MIWSSIEPAGPAAREIDDLWRLLLWLGVAVFVLFAALLLGAIRRGHHARDADPAQPVGGSDDVHGASVRPWLVGGGVVLPALVVGAVLVATVFAMRATADEGSEGALVVEVVGHQWWWEVSYPDEGAETANEVHIPVGEPVTLELTSADVIHSFWVPALAGKLDALPDDTNRLVIEADEPGRYEGSCAEFCGLQHANMSITVVAHEPGDFDAWLRGQRRPAAEPTEGPAREGARIFGDEGCGRCHTVTGTEADGDRGPDLTHLMDRRRIAGGMLATTSADLRRWLRSPHDVKEGSSMPDPELSESQLDAVVAYLETLR